MRASSPPIIEERERSKIFLWLGLAFGAGSVALLYFLNPAQHGFYPRCFFKMATGLDCPGCGGLRATHQLLHGNIREAFLLNPLFVASLPIAGFFVLRALIERATGRKWRRLLRLTTAVWTCAVIVIAFGVLRNVPWRRWFDS